MALTPKQTIFADEYLIDLNATRAYKVAYPSCKKDEAAAVNGSKLLRNTKVEKYIQERMRERQERTEITQDWVLSELAKIAKANGSDFARVIIKNGIPFVEMIPTEELPEEKRAAIAAIKESKYGIAVESYDRLKALELIGRHLGMFKDKLELSGGLDKEKSKLDDLIQQMRGDG